MTRRLIEEWLPIAEIGIESQRERTPMTPFPAPNRLHVWWARRPLIAARAAVMASLLPADTDRARFLHALGIHGDPVAARKRIEAAKRTNINLGPNPYGYARAFSYSLSQKDHEWFAYEAQRALGITDKANVLDPTAGGGSIPFEALRLHADVFANDLNPVAVLVQKATYELPMMGVPVLEEFKRLAMRFLDRAQPLYEGIFPREAPDTLILGYLFARTLKCPYCGGLIPLSPNWRLAPDGTGVRLHPHTDTDERICTFEIVHSAREQSEGTVGRDRAICPFPDCGRVIEGVQLKAIAQSEGLGEQLYAVVYKQKIQTVTKAGKPGRDKWVRGYRAPEERDNVFDEIRTRLEEKLPYWEAMDMVPIEAVPCGYNTDQAIRYGIYKWTDFFSPRQLYCHCTDVQKAAFAYLALALDKLRDYNSRMTRWITQREVMANTFDRHDFAFKWSYAEMAPLIVGLGYDWALEQVAKCLAELTALLNPDINIKALKKQEEAPVSFALLSLVNGREKSKIALSCAPADHLDHIDAQSIDAVVMDPPYYDNVMYAELSDFFYVWLKRTAGYVYPELFTLPITDKDNEAVANPAKFRGQKKAKALAHLDYQKRMAAIFKECHRVLKKDSILTLMFTHKATGAWDALTKGLLDAGFAITASWPINTEATGSLHIKDKAAANSTIFLVCRPREEKTREEAFWEELEPQVKRHVLQRLDAFKAAGIGGIDLYLACFGPALELFSKNWPVTRGTPRPQRETSKQRKLTEVADPYAVTPEDVLMTARSAVKDWAMRQILQAQRRAQMDPLLEWYVLAWSTFKAPQFPYDEAMNLARVVGLELDKDIVGVVAEKKQSDIVLWDSETRAARAALGPASGANSMLDALHQAIRTAHAKTLQAAADQIRGYGLDKEPAFLDGLKALLEVLPVSRTFSGYEPGKALEPAARDFEALENLRRLAFSKEVTITTRVEGSLLDLADE